MSEPPLLLGLIGTHIQASRSPAMHVREAAAHGLRCEYRLLDLEREGPDVSLAALLETAEREGFAGLNVTHPCKQTIMPLLDELSPESRALGAVNTVVLRDGRRSGHNTDWWAFRESFREGLRGAALDCVVQIGAGGAGAATAYAMLEMGAGRVTILDLVPDRATVLAERLGRLFPGRVGAAEALDAAVPDADGIIHATPVGMAAQPGMAMPTRLLRPALWVAEVVYVPLETALLRAARAAGCRTLNGAGMAVYQAVEAFRLFTGLHADVTRMRDAFARSGPVS